MLSISVCVGSACHLKGSYEVIEKLKECVRKNNLEESVIIKAAFCLGNCTEAVSTKFEDKIYSVVPDTVEKFFSEKVLEELKK
jgi:NADH:ubiquinone oxidoreductase subunit E